MSFTTTPSDLIFDRDVLASTSVDACDSCHERIQAGDLTTSYMVSLYESKAPNVALIFVGTDNGGYCEFCGGSVLPHVNNYELLAYRSNK